MKFTELPIPENILTTLKKIGYDELTPIQEATYGAITSGRDVCALAETGSGKTAACAIPLIQMVDSAQNTIQGLIIVPTRELCVQYVEEISRIAAGTPVVAFAVFGGFDKGIQAAKLSHGVHLLVATPGRLIDFMYNGVVNLEHVKCAILDEADELLKVSFLDDIEFILSCVVHEHQTLLFSATMAEEIKKLAHDCLRNPEHISLIHTRAAPTSLDHYFAYVHPKDKMKELLRYLKSEKISQGIIFCNARYRVDSLCRLLRQEVNGVDFIHAGLTQSKRSSIINQFRQKKIHLLIATDVAGRGLDFSHVSHIINWDFPGAGDQYTHRTGRAGRMGRKGKAFTLISRHDLNGLGDVVRKKKIAPIWIGRDPLNDQPPQKRHFKRQSRPPHGHRKRRTS